MNKSIKVAANLTKDSDDNLPDVFELSAFRFEPVQRINRIICCISAFLLNILVAVVIVRSRQLWTARYIFWLALSLFNLIAVIDTANELGIFYLYQKEDGSHLILCEIFSTLIGCPYGLVLSGQLLSSFDRYLALARYQFYQKYATTKNAVWIVVLTFLLVTGGVLSPFWTGRFTIECGVRYKWLTTILLLIASLSMMSLAIQTRIFFFVHELLHYAPAKENIEMGLITRPQHREVSLDGKVGGQRRNRSNNRLEIRAAITLAFGILPFSAVNLTLCVCALVADLRSPEYLNSWLRTVMMVCRELILYHFVYIPIVLIVQSREFQAAVKRFRRTKRQPSADELN